MPEVQSTHTPGMPACKLHSQMQSGEDQAASWWCFGAWALGTALSSQESRAETEVSHESTVVREVQSAVRIKAIRRSAMELLVTDGTATNDGCSRACQVSSGQYTVGAGWR